MKNLPILLTSTIVTAWAVAAAILSVQNADYVSLRFFGLQSIQLPVGIFLGASVGVGAIAGAIAQMLKGSSEQPERLPRSTTSTSGKNAQLGSDRVDW